MLNIHKRVEDLKAERSEYETQVDELNERLKNAEARYAHIANEKKRYKKELPRMYDRGFFNSELSDANEDIQRLKEARDLRMLIINRYEDEIGFLRDLIAEGR